MPMRALADPSTWAALINLAFIAALPRLFFRRGRLNAHWWLTAAPFFLAGVGLLFSRNAGPVIALPSGYALANAVVIMLQLAGLGCTLASIALIAFTLGTHQQPVSLWHQPNDTPAALVTHGAYTRVRHPFYGAFLLALCGCVLVAPSLLTAGALVFAAVQLRRTARREETRLLVAFGEVYAAYMRRTGRFWPRLSGG